MFVWSDQEKYNYWLSIFYPTKTSIHWNNCCQFLLWFYSLYFSCKQYIFNDFKIKNEIYKLRIVILSYHLFQTSTWNFNAQKRQLILFSIVSERSFPKKRNSSSVSAFKSAIAKHNSQAAFSPIPTDLRTNLNSFNAFMWTRISWSYFAPSFPKLFFEKSRNNPVRWLLISVSGCSPLIPSAVIELFEIDIERVLRLANWAIELEMSLTAASWILLDPRDNTNSVRFLKLEAIEWVICYAPSEPIYVSHNSNLTAFKLQEGEAVENEDAR